MAEGDERSRECGGREGRTVSVSDGLKGHILRATEAMIEAKDYRFAIKARVASHVTAKKERNIRCLQLYVSFEIWEGIPNFGTKPPMSVHPPN